MKLRKQKCRFTDVWNGEITKQHPTMPLPTLEANSISEGILPDIQKNGRAAVQDAPTIVQNYDEPIATRRELWSYYRMYNFPFSRFLSCGIDNGLSSVYHFGNNVGFPHSLSRARCGADFRPMCLICRDSDLRVGNAKCF